MSTIVGFKCKDGVLLAADRLLVRNETIESTSKERLFVVDDVAGAACDGPAGAIDEFGREFERVVRSYQTERGPIGIDPLETQVSSITADVGIDAIVATHDEDGIARVSALGRDGSQLSDSPLVRGTGAQLFIGALGIEGGSLDTVEPKVRSAFKTVAENDPKTGEAVDVWRLPNVPDVSDASDASDES